MSEINRCIDFLKLNGWKNITDPGSEYTSFYKDGLFGVDFDDEEMVFIAEKGDIIHRPIDFFCLIGVLLHYKQIAINYKFEGDNKP